MFNDFHRAFEVSHACFTKIFGGKIFCFLLRTAKIILDTIIQVLIPFLIQTVYQYSGPVDIWSSSLILKQADYFIKKVGHLLRNYFIDNINVIW